jgi:hypothetical protein
MFKPKLEQDGDAMHNSAQMELATDDQLSRDFEALRRVTGERLPSLLETERRLHERLRASSVSKRKLLVAGCVAAACSTALAAPLLVELSAPKVDAPTSPTAAPDRGVAAPAATQPSDADHPSSAKPTATQLARAKRDALRREIVRHVPPVNAAVAPTAAAPAPARAPLPTDLTNKMGPGREKLVAFLNDEFSPLLAECVEQAEARAPTQAGMFFIGIETLAYEELGAVVEVAAPTERNQLADPLFIECVRESAFTLIIPPPLTNGQEKFEVNGFFGARPTSGE